MSHWTLRRLWTLTLLLLSLLILWDASGLDLPLARWFGSAQGFAWRGEPLFVLLLHEVPRFAGMALLVTLLWGAVKPWGFLRQMVLAQRMQLLLPILGGLMLVSILKRLNSTSCPWDLAEFGGVAQYVSHWLWGVRDGGPGHCFPAGHASAAFAYLAGWFALRRVVPRVAGPWLLCTVLVGLVLGLSQQMRGAHYMSHTLWTAWICWTWGLALDSVVQLRSRSAMGAMTGSNLKET